jgi:hypothetical protein
MKRSDFVVQAVYNKNTPILSFDICTHGRTERAMLIRALEIRTTLKCVLKNLE